MICDTNNLIIAKIYPNCSEKNRKIIKDHFEKWIGDISWKSFEMYYYIVMNSIIEPNEKYEQSIFDNLNAIKDKSRGCYPNDYQNILVTMYNLYMGSKLIQVERFKIVAKESDDIELVFLNDMDHFDYGEIDARLLRLYFKHFANTVEEN